MRPSESTSLPQYTATEPGDHKPIPEITILLLGSPGVGKSTFVRAIPHVRNGRLQETFGKAQVSATELVPNPLSFQVSLFARPYQITIHRSTSTLFIDPFPGKISCVVLCYAVDDRASLFNAQKYWRRVYAERYETELGTEVPLMLLGLKRDLRTDAKVQVSGNHQGEDQETKEEEFLCVMPDHGVRVANEMRCDRYAECSAATGELMWEALEDITRMAAGTTTKTGGFSEGSSCSVM